MEDKEHIQAWRAGGVEDDRAVSAELGVGARDLDKVQTLLAELELDSADVAALRRQGFVSREVRGGGRIVYKLRFRLDRRQRVKCLGADEELARRVEETLSRLQRPRRKTLVIGRLTREAARLLRDGKRRIEPWLDAAGYRFHGQAIRRPRSRKGAEV
jgi:hypothetical protein